MIRPAKLDWRHFLPIVLVILGVDVIIGLADRLAFSGPLALVVVLDALGVAVVAGPAIWLIVANQLSRTAEVEQLRADARVGSVVAASIDGIITTDVDGVVTHFNVGAERMFGYKAGEILGREIGVLIPDAVRAVHSAHVARVAAGPVGSRPMGAVSGIEGLRKDGTRFAADVSITKIDAQGETIITAIVRDVTERRAAESAIREAEQRLRTVVNNAPITIWATDAEGVFTFSDGAALAGVGLVPGQNVGASAVALFGDLPFSAHDGSRMTGRDVLGRVLGGTSVVATSELQGTIFENHIVPQYSAEGRIVGAIGVATDVTDRFRAEADARATERRFGAVFDHAPVGIAVVDEATGQYFMVNHEYGRIARRTVDELRALDWTFLAHPDDIAYVSGQMALLRSGDAASVEFDSRFLFSDGDVAWVRCRITWLRDGSRSGKRLLWLVTDISDRVRLVKELREGNERLSSLSRRLIEAQETERRQLARELHDEIGQALSATKINLQALGRYPDPQTLAHRLVDSVDIVNRAIAQVRSLSLLLRPPLLDDLGLAAALRWLAEEISRRTAIPVELREAPERRDLDPALEIACYRIVQEALNNAARHSGARRIVVDARVEDGTLHLRILDDGTGFDVSAARRRAASGASLGIVGMEERATLVGGGIEWRSEPGAGTTVHAWFPIASSVGDRRGSAGASGSTGASGPTGAT